MQKAIKALESARYLIGQEVQAVDDQELQMQYVTVLDEISEALNELHQTA